MSILGDDRKEGYDTDNSIDRTDLNPVTGELRVINGLQHIFLLDINLPGTLYRIIYNPEYILRDSTLLFDIIYRWNGPVTGA